MSIFFECACGQPLQMNGDRAGSKVNCPACGRRVSVPLGQHTPIPDAIQLVPPMPSLQFRVVELPSTRAQAEPADEDGPYGLAQEPREAASETDRSLARQEARRLLARAMKEQVAEHKKRQWRLEKHWYECLVYALRAFALEFSLAAMWAGLIAFTWLLPAMHWDPLEIAGRSVIVLIAFLLMGFTVAFFRKILAAARAGAVGDAVWPGGDMAKTVTGGAQAVIAFLAGPVVPLVVACYFWLNSGDMQLVDELILWELGIISVIWWVLALLAIQKSRQLSDVNPVAMVNLIRQIGYRLPVAALLIAVGVAAQAAATLVGVAQLHSGPGGWVLLTTVWTASFFWLVFVLRWLGINWPADRKKRPTKAETAVAGASFQGREKGPAERAALLRSEISAREPASKARERDSSLKGVSEAGTTCA